MVLLKNIRQHWKNLYYANLGSGLVIYPIYINSYPNIPDLLLSTWYNSMGTLIYFRAFLLDI